MQESVVYGSLKSEAPYLKIMAVNDAERTCNFVKI
jgi:hypothetical protein